MGIDGKFYKADRDVNSFYDGIHSTELRSVLGRTLIPKDKANISYAYTQSTIVNERTRPQTASKIYMRIMTNFL